MNAKTVQQDLVQLLLKIFGRDNVFPQWQSSKEARDWLRFGTDLYAPKPDIGVGPFNIWPGRNTSKIDITFDKHKDFFHSLDVKDTSLNTNPRCLVAIEIENSNTGKHMIGNILNASILGKVGIVITFRERFERDAIRVRRYLDMARRRGKTKLSASNVVVMTYEEFRRILLDIPISAQ